MFSSALDRLRDITIGRKSKATAVVRRMTPFVYPSTWTARTRLPTSCRCYRSGMDALVAAIFHNEQCSRLCRLPDELLLIVMKELDYLSIQCLRRASRTFLRLYSSPEFSSSHLLSFRNYSSSCEFGWLNPWPEPDIHLFNKQQLASVLSRDTGGYCNDCRSARCSPSWQHRVDQLTTETLHCSGCQIDHPKILFSARQRREPQSISRICIGHEGYVRFCEHRVIKWAEVALPAFGLSQLDTGSPDRQARIFLPRCYDPSHEPKKCSSSSKESANEYIHPAVFVDGNNAVNITLELEWVGHLELPELDSQQDLTPELVHQKLERELRPGVAEHVAQELPPGRLPEMSCLDPNRCDCLHYSNKDELHRGWPLMLPSDIPFPTCRADSQQKLGHGGHQGCVSIITSISDGYSWLEVNMNPCLGSTSTRCLQVKYRRIISLVPRGYPRGRINAGWLNALDPDSYNLTTDDESFGLFWCRQKGCLNYYRYTPRPFKDFKNMHCNCSASCPAG